MYNTVHLTSIYCRVPGNRELLEAPPSMRAWSFARTTGLGISLAFPPPFFSEQSYGLYLRGLMHGVGNSPLTGLRATSQNILWSTTKVSMCLVPTRRMTKVRLSTNSPHRVVIPRFTPEYQYPWFRFIATPFFQHAGCCII